jgi:hypothetical protein
MVSDSQPGEDGVGWRICVIASCHTAGNVRRHERLELAITGPKSEMSGEVRHGLQVMPF